MKSFKFAFIILSSVLTLISCTDEKIIVAPAVESIQSCRADFIQDIEFRYTITAFFNGDIFVSCELTDFELNKSVSSNQYYARDSFTDAANRLACSLFHEITPLVLAGEFIFDTVNNTPGMIFFNEFPAPDGTFQVPVPDNGTSFKEFIYAESACTFESF